MPTLSTLVLSLAAFQGPTSTLDVAGGVIGGNLEVQLSGTPGQTHVLLPSPTSGPTPVSRLDPTFSSSGMLDIDLSLAALAIPGAYSTGLQLPIPNDPALRGTRVYLQALDVPGPTSLIAGWTNPATAFLSAHGDVDAGPMNLAQGRALATASTLPNGDVLIAGGSTGGFLTPVPLRDALLLDHNTRAIRSITSQMSHGRAFHTATGLPSGQVAVFGGFDPTRAAVSSCDVFDPATETFLPLQTSGVPLVARAMHTATRLASGEILIVGGSTNIGTGTVLGPFGNITGQAQILDPSTGVVTDVGMSPAVVGHSATLLPNGWVLIYGGLRRGLLGVPVLNNNAWIYDPVSSSFYLTSNPSSSRLFHAATPVGGTVVMTGGLAIAGTFPNLSFSSLRTAESFHTTTLSFVSMPDMGADRLGHVTVFSPAGELVIVGGVTGRIPLSGQYNFLGVGSIEVLRGGSFVTLPSTITPRGLFAGAILDPTHVAILGGLTSATAPTDIVEFLTF